MGKKMSQTERVREYENKRNGEIASGKRKILRIRD